MSSKQHMLKELLSFVEPHDWRALGLIFPMDLPLLQTSKGASLLRRNQNPLHYIAFHSRNFASLVVF